MEMLTELLSFGKSMNELIRYIGGIGGRKSNPLNPLNVIESMEKLSKPYFSLQSFSIGVHILAEEADFLYSRFA
jgi:hypothetical protein